MSYWGDVVFHDYYKIQANEIIYKGLNASFCFPPYIEVISYHYWSKCREDWTCRESSWLCPRSGCWGWRAGWPWSAATRWSSSWSLSPSLVDASSCWQPQCSRLDPWSFDMWRSKTNTGSKCFFLLFNIRHAIKVTLWKYITVIMFLTSLNFCSRSLILLQISCWTIGLIVALLTIDCVLGSRFAIIDCFTNIAF